MKVIVISLLLVVLLSVVYGHGGHHHNNNNEQQHVNSVNSVKQKSNDDMCKYTNDKGEKYNLHLFDGAYSQLQFYDQSNTKSTVYVQVCGALPTNDWGCGANSSVCVVSSAMKGTSFGSNTNVQRAYINHPQQQSGGSSLQNQGVELMFGNGELCNNGIARKATVTYVCDMNVQDTAYSYPKVTGTIDDCFVAITVKSPLACPVTQVCASIHDSETCKLQSPICSWNFGKCKAAAVGCFGSDVEIDAGIISFIIVTAAGLCLICVCGLCICVCRKRCRKPCPKKAAAKRSSSSSTTKGGASKKSRSASKPKPEANFDNLPIYQLVPASTPINPYNMDNIQQYYMMPHQDVNNSL